MELKFGRDYPLSLLEDLEERRILCDQLRER